jgi:hypothetical protein
MVKNASERKAVIDGMGRRNEGRMTVLEAVMGQYERERAYFIGFVAIFVGWLSLWV